MATTIQASTGGPRGYPIAEVFQRIGVGQTTGFSLIKSGELKTYTIGTRRFATEEEVSRFLRARVEAASKELPESRAQRVEKAVAGRTKQRANAAA